MERTLLSAASDFALALAFVLDLDSPCPSIRRVLHERPQRRGIAALPAPRKAPENSTGLQPPRGNFRQFSAERLLRFLVALDQDVHIVVKPHHNRKNAPALQVF